MHFMEVWKHTIFNVIDLVRYLFVLEKLVTTYNKIKNCNEHIHCKLFFPAITSNGELFSFRLLISHLNEKKNAEKPKTKFECSLHRENFICNHSF